MRTAHRIARVGGLSAAAGLVALTLAAPAAAHVTVNSVGAKQGGYAVLTFRVPTESDTASTTALSVQFSLDTPITSVSVQPHPGWSFTTKKSKLPKPIKTDDGQITQAVSEVDWKADSAATAIKPGEFDQFNVSAGPLPTVDTLTFRAIQTYSDGRVVKWIETPAPGSTSQPEHPAPKLTLAAASTTAAGSSAAPSSGSSSSDGKATAGIVLGGIGAALGLAALAMNLRRRRA